MRTINMKDYAVGTRLLVRFTNPENKEIYNTLSSIEILEWSPSGKAVRIKGGDGEDGDRINNYCGILGWYDRKRMKVVEELPRLNSDGK